MKNKNIPELLSPAGNFQKLKYAFAYGADAVYAGVPKFSLRTRENDFNEKSLQSGIEYAHKLNKKIYLTLNIFAHNTKINSFLKELEKVIQWHPDGLIMADPGLVNIALKKYPEIPIHLSTQANVTNWTTVMFWRDLGVKRIILSRELSIKEIREIHENVPDIELECFVHGAICIAYSGRCLITNYMNHRDANQGTCTNSCRWQYTVEEDTGSLLEHENSQISAYSSGRPVPENITVREEHRPEEKFSLREDEFGTYMFNSKDLCAIELLKDLNDSGVISFKIEGRTKSEYYAAMVTRTYRSAIDDMMKGKPFNQKHINDLNALSNRGYTTGFYTRNPREFGENYEDARSLERTHKVVGIDCRYHIETDILTFETKNKICSGTEIEVITPTGTELFLIQKLYDEKNNILNAGHGGAGRCGINYPVNPGEFAILRRKLYDDE